jgi:predicted alpha/beta hydrolase
MYPSEETKRIMQAIANGVDQYLNQDTNNYGFVVLVFENQGPNRSKVNYVSNCSRDSMIEALEEFLSRCRKGMVKGTDTVQ